MSQASDLNVAMEDHVAGHLCYLTLISLPFVDDDQEYAEKTLEGSSAGGIGSRGTINEDSERSLLLEFDGTDSDIDDLDNQYFLEHAAANRESLGELFPRMFSGIQPAVIVHRDNLQLHQETTNGIGTRTRRGGLPPGPNVLPERSRSAHSTGRFTASHYMPQDDESSHEIDGVGPRRVMRQRPNTDPNNRRPSWRHQEAQDDLTFSSVAEEVPLIEHILNPGASQQKTGSEGPESRSHSRHSSFEPDDQNYDPFLDLGEQLFMQKYPIEDSNKEKEEAVERLKK
ncbi:hypothetical protein BDV12DRAFT_199750 [Aspergillus spectabilis]